MSSVSVSVKTVSCAVLPTTLRTSCTTPTVSRPLTLCSAASSSHVLQSPTNIRSCSQHILPLITDVVNFSWICFHSTYLLRSGRGVEYCNQLVTLSVCLQAYLWNCWTDLHKFFCADPCGCGAVLLRWLCDMLCSSSFIDDVTFGHSAPYGDAWIAVWRYRGGV